MRRRLLALTRGLSGVEGLIVMGGGPNEVPGMEPAGVDVFIDLGAMGGKRVEA